jgi:hypothetical protein
MKPPPRLLELWKRSSVLCEVFSKHLWESAFLRISKQAVEKLRKRFAFPQPASGVAVSTGVPLSFLPRFSSHPHS